MSTEHILLICGIHLLVLTVSRTDHDEIPQTCPVQKSVNYDLRVGSMTHLYKKPAFCRLMLSLTRPEHALTRPDFILAYTPATNKPKQSRDDSTNVPSKISGLTCIGNRETYVLFLKHRILAHILCKARVSGNSIEDHFCRIDLLGRLEIFVLY